MIKAIEVKNLQVRFPTPSGYSAVVRGIDLTIKPGERIAIVGESGSGKTMLGLSMLGIQPSSAKVTGEVIIGDVDMVSANDATARKLRGKYIYYCSRRNRAIGYCRQDWSRYKSNGWWVFCDDYISYYGFCK